MGIKIILKKTIKPQTGGQNTSPVPFIDRLSIIIEPASEADAISIHEAIWPCFGDGDKGFKSWPKGITPSFRRAARLALPSLMNAKHYPMLQYAFEKGTEPWKATKLRLDFVPVDLGYKGLLELHSFLMVLPDGWNYVVKHGTITRIDVAVDFVGVGVSDFHFLPQQGATSKQWRSTGTMTGFAHGKGKGNQTLVYDRKQKRIDLKENSAGKEGTRVERKLRKPSMASLLELPELANPFLCMTMVGLPLGCPASELKPYIWELFKHAADVKGLPAALALLPKDKKKTYRAHFTPHALEWWDPEAIWTNWPKMLDELKIGKLGW